MSNHSGAPAAIPAVSGSASQERLSAMQIYCAYARDAASEGRLVAAHGLFQTALWVFEQAKCLAESDDQLNLCGAYHELDNIARVVYPLDACAPTFRGEVA